MAISQRIDGMIEMITSLNSAIQRAGGTVQKWEKIKDWTVEELMFELGQNNIRFVFDRGNKDECK